MTRKNTITDNEYADKFFSKKMHSASGTGFSGMYDHLKKQKAPKLFPTVDDINKRG